MVFPTIDNSRNELTGSISDKKMNMTNEVKITWGYRFSGVLMQFSDHNIGNLT